MKTNNILEKLELEHEEIQFKSFSNSLALKIGLRLVEKAEKENLILAIDITRNNHQLFHYSFAGTSSDNDAWIIRKNRVVNRFEKSSIYMKEFIKDKNSSLEKMYCLDSMEYAAFGGSFPIIIKDTGVIGTVTVSGLPDEEDHEFVVSVLREFIPEDTK